jgi:hypothetical protein
MSIALDEHFFRWEPGRRFSFYGTGASMPLVHALAEDYLLEELAPGKTRLTYSVAMEARAALRIGGLPARAFFDSTFRKACKGLQSYLVNAQTPPHFAGADASPTRH